MVRNENTVEYFLGSEFSFHGFELRLSSDELGVDWSESILDVGSHEFKQELVQILP